jgi:hypothetical protein
MRTLFLDTCSILKYFLPEKGSEFVRWMCSRKALLCGVRCTSTPRVRQKFFDVIDMKCQSGHISQDQADQIKTTASELFKRLIHVREDIPLPGQPGRDITEDELVERHKLTIFKNNWDKDHIGTIVNHLRFLASTSTTQVVTADTGFGEILEREGYVSINPEAKKLEDLLVEWSTAKTINTLEDRPNCI